MGYPQARVSKSCVRVSKNSKALTLASALLSSSYATISRAMAARQRAPERAHQRGSRHALSAQVRFCIAFEQPLQVWNGGA